MYASLIFVITALAVANGQGFLNPEDCIDHPAGHGQEVYCDSGYVAVGVCGSGENEDCNEASIILTCCAVVTATGEKIETHACEGKEGGHGSPYECSTGLQVISLCGSGENPDCGGNASAKSTCCDGNGITTGDQSYCRWSYGGVGQKHTCAATSEVMVGYCGSGQASDCDGYQTMLKCCSYY